MIQTKQLTANENTADKWGLVRDKMSDVKILEKWIAVKKRLAEIINPKREEEFLLTTDDEKSVYSIQLYNSFKMYGAFLIKSSGSSSTADLIISFKFKNLTNIQFKSSLKCVLWSIDVFETYLLNRKISINKYFHNLNNKMRATQTNESTIEIEDHLTLQDTCFDTNIRKNNLLDEMCKYLECFY